MASACTDGADPVVAEDDSGPIEFERNSEFSGPRLRVFLDLEDGTPVSVDTTDDAEATRPGQTPIPGHQARDWTFIKDDEIGTSVVYALVSWDPEDPADYLMAGWWAQFPGQHLPNLSFAESARYAIVDGPEMNPASPPQPASMPNEAPRPLAKESMSMKRGTAIVALGWNGGGAGNGD